MEQQTEKLTSKYNEASFQIQRLHNIWLDARRHRENGSLQKYKWVLDSAEIELTTDIVKKGKEINPEHSKALKKVNEDIEKAKARALYVALMEKEKLLRQIQDAAGKGGVYENPDEDEMD